MEKSQQMHLQMKLQVNSENNDMDTQTSDIKHTWRRSRKHTRRKAGEYTQQLEIISAPSTGRMSSVPLRAPTWRIISATIRAPETWWEDQESLICAKGVNVCLLKQFRTRPEMISERTEWSTELDRARMSLNGIMRHSGDNYREIMTEHSNQDHGRMTSNWHWIRGLSGAIYSRHRLGCVPNRLPKRIPNDHTGGL